MSGGYSMYPKAKWNRAALKAYAKVALKNYYWWAVLACLITALLSGSSVSSSGSNITYQITNNELSLKSFFGV